MTAWLFLIAAIACEVAGTLMLKLSQGFEQIGWGVAAMVSYTASFWLLAPALTVIPVGVAYAIWAGLGIAAAAVIGFVGFGEKLGGLQLVCIAFIVTGAAGLRLSTTT